ncbi:MAG TPA: hypothetical protein VGH38_36745 [Bryobacteraceae bacterium]|jgi:hypothetical protein
MAVTVKTTPQFEAGTPKALFQTRTYTRGPWRRDFRWAPAADGQRFLVISGSEGSANAPITVTLNWQAALKH